MAHTVLVVLIVILIVLVIVLVGLYFLGRRMERRQVENEALIEQTKQRATIMAIDKKKMALNKVPGLPAQITEQTPWYAKRSKMPVVKAKVGPRIVNLIADPGVYEAIPLMTEIKVYISGIYITGIIGSRTGAVTAPEKKGNFFQRHFGKYTKAAHDKAAADAGINTGKKKKKK